MSVTRLDPSRAKVAREVHDLLGAMTAQLDAAVKPERVALRLLGVDAAGWTKTPYHADAFKVWSELLRRDPDHIEARHHLAIMHHARAFDLEAGADPARSDPDWEAALEHWHRLWRLDQFWSGIADIACKGTKRDPVDVVRAALPRQVLQVHFDIAYDKDTKNYRAAYHIGLALKSRFAHEAAEAVEAVRAAAYGRLIEDVPKLVWNSDTYDPKLIDQGARAIRDYLEHDSGCIPALADAVRLQERLVCARFPELRAAGNDERTRTRLFDLIMSAAGPWRPYFDQVRPEQFDEDTRHKLSRWYRFMGEIQCEAGDPEQGVDFCERALKTCAQGDDERKWCVKVLGDTAAFAARDKARRKANDAKGYCDGVSKRTDLSVQAHNLLANAYRDLDETDLAKDICARGLKVTLDPSETDYEMIEAHEKGLLALRMTAGSIEAHGLCDRAVKLIQEGREPDAVPLLDQAIKLAPHELTLHFLRCRCHVSLGHAGPARADLERFRASEGADAGAGEAVKTLEQQVAAEEQVLASAGEEAYSLRAQSIAQRLTKHPDRAVELLRLALSRSARRGRAVLHQELATVLINWAVDEANAALANKGKLLTAREIQTAVQEALQRLEEACRLDPKSQVAKERLSELKQILPHLQEQVALAAEYGSLEAFELRQSAVTAFNADRHEEAIGYLRRALTASRNARKIREELSLVLTQAALAQIKTGGGLHGTIRPPLDLNVFTNPLGWRDSIRQFEALKSPSAKLREATELDPANTTARDALRAFNEWSLR